MNISLSYSLHLLDQHLLVYEGLYLAPRRPGDCHCIQELLDRDLLLDIGNMLLDGLNLGDRDLLLEGLDLGDSELELVSYLTDDVAFSWR